MANNRANNKAKKKKSSGGLNTGYLTKMGIHNIAANRSMSFSSVSVLTACLLLIGISLMILANIQTLVKDVEKQNVVIVFVKDDATDEETAKVGTDLSTIPDVVAVEFVSKEQGYQELLDDISVEQGLFDGILENPLPHSYRVSVTNLENFNVTLELIKGVPNVDVVSECQDLVNQITALQNSVTTICAIVVAVLGVVSLFIISNTIRITMVSRKIDIEVMKSVGATSIFICWPFMIEGVIIGLISGVISIVLTMLVDVFEGESMQELLSNFGSEAISIMDYLPLLIVSYLAAGVIIGSMGSVVSIRKYLKKEGSEANDIV